MRNIVIFLFINLLMITTACSNEPQVNDTKQKDIPFASLSAGNVQNQQIAQDVQDLLQSSNTFNSVSVVHSDRDILVALEVKQMKRFQLEEIRKNTKELINEKFPDFKVVVSTDKKVQLELEKLQTKIQAKKLTDQKINKLVKEIISLSKEKT